MTTSVSLSSNTWFETEDFQQLSIWLRLFVRLADNLLLALMALIPTFILIILLMVCWGNTLLVFSGGNVDLLKDSFKFGAQLFVIALVILLEAFYIHKQGATPIKGLAGISVRNRATEHDGLEENVIQDNWLSYKQALIRAFHANFSLWCFPYGFWILFQAKTSRRLPWDTSNISLSQKSVSSWRLWIIKALGSLLAILALIEIALKIIIIWSFINWLI